MVCYVFDGTFEGLLTSIYEAYYNHIKPEEIIPDWQFQPSLIKKPISIKTDAEKSLKVHNAIKNKISAAALENIYYVFLSELEGSCTIILNYIKLGFKLGNEIDLHLHNDTVLAIHKIRRKVTYETHRMLGFVRFKCINNIYYSQIEPDHNILCLLAEHFASRLQNELWIIHDLKRGLALIYNKREWYITSLSKESGEDIFNSGENGLYEELWKDFFRSIAINDRINPRLQKRMMPSRYWKHLTEF
ncbi:putative DNA metabolism protein [Clostridiales bacterium oral taxon 876 str. F0540]|nr:putative DNA metabolism protein [Clostridiales bacterium oral taxon 876 str. F0540]